MFTASKSALKAVLDLSNHVVERRNTIPILANLLIRGGDDRGQLSAVMTDLDMEAEMAFEAAVEPSFSGFTAPAGLLREIVGKLPDGAEAKLEADGKASSGIVLKSGRSRFTLQTLPEADFPSLAMGKPAWRFTVSAAALADALARVAFAISTEETRYYLNGVFLHAGENGRAVLVATDGHRLARRSVKVEGTPPKGVIIPRKTVGVISRQLPKEGEVEVSGDDGRINFVLPRLRLTSKLIDGTFPDYQRIIPRDPPISVEVDAAAFGAAIGRVAVVCSDRGKGCRLTFADGEITISVNNPDAGAAEETLACEGGESLQVGLNAKYVQDALAQLPAGILRLGLTDPGTAVLLRTDGDHVDNLTIQMPMRV